MQEFNTLFLTRFRTYKIASPPQTKMTSKHDIKFLRPWVEPSTSMTYPIVYFIHGYTSPHPHHSIVVYVTLLLCYIYFMEDTNTAQSV
jgi:hypothetical protein